VLEHPTPNGSIVGERLGDHGSPQVYGSNRICAHDGCEVRLSMYNSADSCALHDVSMLSSSPAKGFSRRRRRRSPVSNSA
jgi:Rieske Fe-S protein